MVDHAWTKGRSTENISRGIPQNNLWKNVNKINQNSLWKNINKINQIDTLWVILGGHLSNKWHFFALFCPPSCFVIFIFRLQTQTEKSWAWPTWRKWPILSTTLRRSQRLTTTWLPLICSGGTLSLPKLFPYLGY